MNMKLYVLVAASIVVLCAASNATAQFAKVSETKVTLPNELFDYRGPCPVELKIGGTIKTEGPGIVNYQFIHETGPLGPVQRLISLRGDTYTVRQKPSPVINENAQFWNDTVTLRILSNPGGDFDSPPIKYKGVCQRVNAVTPTATQSIAYLPAQARFRVTLNGFTCNKATLDGILPGGAGDEVYMLTKTFDVSMDAAGTTVGATRMDFTRTLEYGDVSQGAPQRIRAGSSRQLGSLGGINDGDSFPESPEKRSSNPQNQTLPQFVWEGVIARFKNAVVVLPTIWETDGRTDLLYGRWQQQSLDNGLFTIGPLIHDPSRTDTASAISTIRAEVDQQTRLNQQPGEPRLNARPGDLPIGMRETSGGLMLRAELLILTYDEARRISQLGKAVPIRYVNDAYLGGGDYTLWMQVEELP